MKKSTFAIILGLATMITLLSSCNEGPLTKTVTLYQEGKDSTITETSTPCELMAKHGKKCDGTAVDYQANALDRYH